MCLTARRQDRETGTDCLGPKLQASSYKQRAASNKQLDMKEIIGYILNISPLPRRAIQNFNGA